MSNTLSRRILAIEAKRNMDKQIIWVGSEDTGEIEFSADGRMIGTNAQGKIVTAPQGSVHVKWEG